MRSYSCKIRNGSEAKNQSRAKDNNWRTVEYFYSDPSLKQYTLQRCQQ